MTDDQRAAVRQRARRAAMTDDELEAWRTAQRQRSLATYYAMSRDQRAAARERTAGSARTVRCTDR